MVTGLVTVNRNGRPEVDNLRDSVRPPSMSFSALYRCSSFPAELNVKSFVYCVM